MPWVMKNSDGAPGAETLSSQTDVARMTDISVTDTDVSGMPDSCPRAKKKRATIAQRPIPGVLAPFRFLVVLGANGFLELRG